MKNEIIPKKTIEEKFYNNFYVEEFITKEGKIRRCIIPKDKRRNSRESDLWIINFIKKEQEKFNKRIRKFGISALLPTEEYTENEINFRIDKLKDGMAREIAERLVKEKYIEFKITDDNLGGHGKVVEARLYTLK